MHPFSTRTFLIITVVGIILASICVAVAATDDTKMKYSSEVLSKYEMHENDELEYKLVINGESTTLELTIDEIQSEIGCHWEWETMSGIHKDTGYGYLPKSWFKTDLSELAQDMHMDKSEMVSHTTDFATLSCKHYVYRADNIEYSDPLHILDLHPDGTNTHTGKARLDLWIYNGHVVEYRLTMNLVGGGTYSLSYSLMSMTVAG